MSDYRVAELSGQRWTRCARVIIENPISGHPTATFIEEEALIIGEDEVVTRLSGSCALEASDPDLPIPLRDTTTWEPTGASISLGDLQQAIASAYWLAALARDTATATESDAPFMPDEE